MTTPQHPQALSHAADERQGRSPGLFYLIILCVPMFLTLLDVMAMNVAMPTIGATFRVPVSDWSRIVSCYAIPLAVLLIPGGWLVDRFGARPILIAGILAFTVASLVGGFAPTWHLVLLSRLIQGCAAALMIPAGLVEVNQTWPEPGQKARALGLWSAASAVATALGPAMGGCLVSGLSWQSVFWINVPLGLFALWGLRLGASQREPQRRLPAPDASSPLSVRAFIGSVAGAAIMTAGANGTVQVVTIHLQTTVALPPGQTGLVLLLPPRRLPYWDRCPVTSSIDMAGAASQP